MAWAWRDCWNWQMEEAAGAVRRMAARELEARRMDVRSMAERRVEMCCRAMG